MDPLTFGLLRRAAVDAPASHEIWGGLSETAAARGKVSDALVAARRAISIDAGRVEAWVLLGGQARPVSRAESVRSLRRAVALDPRSSDAFVNLGLALSDGGKFDAAIAAERRGTALSPADAYAWNNLGLALIGAGEPVRALDAFDKAVSFDAELAEAHGNRANVLTLFGRVDDGLTAYRISLCLDPRLVPSLFGLGSALKDQALPELGLSLVERALATDPSNLHAHRSRIVCMLHKQGLRPDELAGAQARMAAVCEKSVVPLPARTDSDDPERRIVIGYVSSDLRRHPVARFLRSLFEHRDRNLFKVCIFSDCRNEDSETLWFRARSDVWHRVVGLNDAEVAELVRKVGVDILVFTAGYFDDNRPSIAAHRPAPVHAVLLDAASSGLGSMDYFLSDEVLHPPSSVERFSERLLHVPVLHNFPMPTDDPEVSDLPAQSRGYVTFGCFANPARIGPEVIATWSEILRRLPGSRLVLKHRTAFQTGDIRSRFERAFASQGIDLDRLDLMTADDDRKAHQARYRQVDIALDTFRFNGASTSFDAMWMGIPVVTLAGWSFVERMTKSFLAPVGLSELSANTTNEYIDTAVTLASDTTKLAGLRRDLRRRLARSALCDGQGYALSIEAAYKTMWQSWCRRR